MTKIVYTAHGSAAHGGRGVGDGRTDDGKVAVRFSTPKAMGGDDGPGTNPEQLFAVGYSACFLGAMGGAARRQGNKCGAKRLIESDIYRNMVSMETYLRGVPSRHFLAARDERHVRDPAGRREGALTCICQESNKCQRR